MLIFPFLSTLLKYMVADALCYTSTTVGYSQVHFHLRVHRGIGAQRKRWAGIRILIVWWIWWR